MIWKNAIDWLFCTDAYANRLTRQERISAYKNTKLMCPVDKELDSPCPRWVLNMLMCDAIPFRLRVKLVFKHHQIITGQKISAFTNDDIEFVEKEK